MTPRPISPIPMNSASRPPIASSSSVAARDERPPLGGVWSRTDPRFDELLLDEELERDVDELLELGLTRVERLPDDFWRFLSAEAMDRTRYQCPVTRWVPTVECLGSEPLIVVS